MGGLGSIGLVDDAFRVETFRGSKGLAEYAERHGNLFERIQLIRQSGNGYARLEINQAAVREKLRLATTNAQLDALFSMHG